MKSKIKPNQKAEAKSLGTTIAEKGRAKANTYSDERRQALLEQGLAMIHGGTGRAKSSANRR